MKALLVARKSLVEMLREFQLLGLVVLMPLLFVVITVVGYNNMLLVTHPVLVINLDPRGTPLIEELEAQRYADGRPIFDITLTKDREATEMALKEQTATALVVISPDDAGGQSLHVTIRGDALYRRFYRASTILSSVANRYADRVAGQPEVVRVVEQPIVAAGSSASLRTGPQTEFDLYAPGMIIFALLLITPQTAMLVAREIRWHTLRRLRLTRLSARSLLGGMSIAQMVVAVAQVVVFLAALAFGFHNQGSVWLAIGVGLIVSFSAIGQGLVVACFVENDSQAANVGATISMLQVFLSGAMYQLPPLTVFTLAGHQIDVFDVFPATHGFLALQQVLCYGAGLREIAFRLGATLVLSALYFVVGVVVFHRLQMRSNS